MIWKLFFTSKIGIQIVKSRKVKMEFCLYSGCRENFM